MIWRKKKKQKQDFNEVWPNDLRLQMKVLGIFLLYDLCGAQMIYGPDPSIRGNPKAQAEEGWGPNSIG